MRFHRYLNIFKGIVFSILTTTNITIVTAQNIDQPALDPIYELEEVTFTASRAPLPAIRAARMVTVLDRKAIATAPVQSVNDLLKYAAGVDVRQRGPIGAQSDISVRGGTNEQITILLNGINISDPQTGHNAVDFPVDISEIDRIEVIEGPAGRVYGTSSLVGAINIVTRTSSKTSADLYVRGGSYGYAQGGMRANLVSGSVNNQISASYTRSDGYSLNQNGGLNSDLKAIKAFYQGSYEGEEVDVRWHAGVSNKDFGANTFYSAKYDDQFEHTLKIFAAFQAESKGALHLKPTLYWNRNYDRFELFRGNEEKVPFNYNLTDIFGMGIDGYVDWKLGRTAFGGEFRNEDLVSGNLGEPLNKPQPIKGTNRDYTLGLNRSNISLHLEHNILLDRLSISAGFVAVKNTWNEMPFTIYPGVDASYQISPTLKAYASFNTSLRVPSFTELYYSVGGHKADKYLKPEEMQAYEVGLKYLSNKFRGTLSVYRHHGNNMIDWIMDTREGENAEWKSLNHTKLNAIGVELSLTAYFLSIFPQQTFLQSVSVAYSHINQDKEIEPYLQSQYALEYLKHKFVVKADFNLYRRLFLHTSYRWQERMGNYQLLSGELKPYGSYGVLDARLSWDGERYHFFLEANNILNTTYYDYGNVPQPGAWLTCGVTLHL